MVGLSVGPIIGHVTSRSAIVLFEVDEDVQEFTCLLLPVNEDGTDFENISKSAHFPANQPRIFKFEGLKSNMQYLIKLPSFSEDVLGVVTTLPEVVERLNIAVVSCDNAQYQAETDMWQVMWEGIDSKKEAIHVLLHIGDNVYMDGIGSGLSNEELVKGDIESHIISGNLDPSTPYVKARQIIDNLDRQMWDSRKDEILEIFRSRYRDTFSRTYIKNVMAHVSNLMILDDHEIRDDFGDVADDSDPESKEFFLGSLAIQVFHEYQRQLWDPEILERDPSSLKSEYFALTLGPLGIIMMDSRTVWANNRSHREKSDTSYYGDHQVQSLRNSLATNEDVKMWLLVFTLPLFFVKKNHAKFAACCIKKADDCLSFMYMNHEEDLVEMLDLLRNWQERKASNSFLILGGDVHVGGFTDVYHSLLSGGESKLLCRQIITSPINNSINEVPGLSCWLGCTDSYGSYTYKHHDLVKECNYALLYFDHFEPSPVYRAKIITGRREIEKHSDDPTWGSQPSGRCCDCRII